METLVLSQSYEPVARVSWQRAMTLFFEGKVEVVEEYTDRQIRTVSLTFNVPAVIRFLKGIRGRKRAVKFSRENVYTRDHGKCQYCSSKVTRAEATYDHVMPRAQGGKTDWNNIVICCVPCNQKKGGRTPQQAKMTLMSIPVKPTKLPDKYTLTIRVENGKSIPEQWKAWIASVEYWNGELEQG